MSLVEKRDLPHVSKQCVSSVSNGFSFGSTPCIHEMDEDVGRFDPSSPDDLVDESTVSKAMSGPVKPTAKMVEDHNVSHLPFRNWCSACVRGRGRSQQHRLQDHSGENVPVVSIDYGFFGSSGNAVADGASGSEMPVLVVRDRRSKATWSHLVPCKGTSHPWPTKVLVQDLDRTGYRKVILKCDQEPSIIALAMDAKSQWSGECIIEHSPKGESKSNGEVERAVQSVHGMTRTLKEHVEQEADIVLDPRSPVLAWMIEDSGTVMNLFHRGEPHDGMTAYHRLRGRPWKIDLPPFGESIEFMRRTQSKLDKRWERGLFLGIKESTSEKIVGNNSGIFVVQSIRRIAEPRYDAKLLTDLRGLPWKPQPDGPERADLPEPITVHPECPDVPRRVASPVIKDEQVRRFYITRASLEKHGYTPGCPACVAMQAKTRKPGIDHSLECRSRIEEAIKSDPVGKRRFDEHEERTTAKIARRIGPTIKARIAQRLLEARVSFRTAPSANTKPSKMMGPSLTRRSRQCGSGGSFRPTTRRRWSTPWSSSCTTTTSCPCTRLTRRGPSASRAHAVRRTSSILICRLTRIHKMSGKHWTTYPASIWIRQVSEKPDMQSWTSSRR